MEKELTQLATQVYAILVLVGFLGGVLRLAYNYIEQALGKQDAFVNGIREVGAATLWVVLIPTVLWLLVTFANLVRFRISLNQVIEVLGTVTKP